MKTATQTIPSAEAMYALIYRVCGEFSQDSETEDQFFLTLDTFIATDLKVRDTQDCFRYVYDSLRGLSLSEIRSECALVPRIMSQASEEVWDAICGLEIELLTK